MKFCRINLKYTNYLEIPNSQILSYKQREENYNLLSDIYKKYCLYKKFDSVMPLFKGLLLDDNADVFVYYQNKTIVAFTIVKKYDKDNVESLQFAWDYKEPKLQLGIKSLKNECAFYKVRGYKYLYLGQVNTYKEQFEGYEVLGPIDGHILYRD